MAIRGNFYFNNPAFAQAASNLGALFGPPDGSDAQGWANANAKREEASRLAQLFAMSQSGDFDQQAFDRGNVAAGNYAPSGSYYAVDKDDATKRYGYDVGASTSRANNAADNQQKFLSGALGPVSQDAVQPAIPSSIGALYGAPAGLPAVNGPRSPLSETEWQAGVNEDLRRRGQLPDQLMIERITGERTPVQAVGPGGKPIFMSPGAAVGSGAEVFINRGAEAKPDIENYIGPDGTGGTATYDPTRDVMVDTQTRQPIPAGSKIHKAVSGGTAEEATGATKSNLTAAGSLRASVANAAALIDELEGLVTAHPAASGVAGDIISFVQDARQVASEFTATFGDQDVLITPETVTALADRILPPTAGYNPVYRKVGALLFEMAYANAKMNDSKGEVSRYDLEQEIKNLGQGMVGNDQAVLAVIDVAKGRALRALAEADVLEKKVPPPTADDPRLQRRPMPAGNPAPAPLPVTNTGTGNAAPVRVRKYNPVTGRVE